MYGSRLRFTLPQLTNLQEKIMSIAGIAGQLSFPSVNLRFLFSAPSLCRGVRTGNKLGRPTKAQRAYNALTELGQNTDGYKPFKSSRLEQDFLAGGPGLSKLEMRREQGRHT
jgi:hypothetical protein